MDLLNEDGIHGEIDAASSRKIIESSIDFFRDMADTIEIDSKAAALVYRKAADHLETKLREAQIVADLTLQYRQTLEQKLKSKRKSKSK